MNDSEFLFWIYERLIYVHVEDKHYDYMIRLINLSESINGNVKYDKNCHCDAGPKWLLLQKISSIYKFCPMCGGEL